MLKLPFKTSPQEFEKVTVGNPQIGELELPKYGDISPNERLFIKAANLIDIRREAVRLANAIAVKSGKKIVDIYDALVGGNAESLEDYLEDFVDFQGLMEENSRQRKLVLTTAIIKSRLVADWGLEDTQDPNQIHPQLVAKVAEFARNEESGWEEAVVEVTEEDLGNSTPTPEIQTGQKSTGESEDTGHKKNGSQKKALVGNQPG
ncbi:hypothetical protein [Nostoc sp.]|uniref:hypothetical protein n=1 Tax=Nostoc sp. TaxID=1180 RepID=UPI002FF1D95A